MKNKRLKSAKSEYNLKLFLSILVIITVFYFLLPQLLNFPKYFDNISFQIETIKIPLIVYFILIGLIFYAIEVFIDKILMKRIDKFVTLEEPEKDKKFIINVREDCMNYPYRFMVVQLLFIIVLSVLAVGFFLAFGRLYIQDFDKRIISIIRLGLLIIAALLLICVAKYYFLKQYLNTVLKESYENNHFYKKNDITISNSTSVVLQLLLMMVAIFIIFVDF